MFYHLLNAIEQAYNAYDQHIRQGNPMTQGFSLCLNDPTNAKKGFHWVYANNSYDGVIILNDRGNLDVEATYQHCPDMVIT